MTQSIVVSQRKTFTVELQSMYGSSPYGWCLSALPEGIILTGTSNEKIPWPYQIGPVLQKFYFSAVACDLVGTIEFVLTASFYPEDVQDTYTVHVQTVPEDPQQFVPYTDNAVANVKYGYMGAAQNCVPAVAYGYPRGYWDAAAPANKPFFKNECAPENKPFFRNECAPENKPFFKNGCAPENKPFFKNGCAPENKPFFRNDDAMKAAIPYGMVYVNDTDDCLYKYGFPNC